MTTSAPTRVQRYFFLLICFISVLVLWGWYQSLLNARTYVKAAVPDFNSIDNVASRKQSFIEYLYPLIAAENSRILQQRMQLLSLGQQLQDGGEINFEQALWLEQIARHYEAEYDNTDLPTSITLLLKRLDVIPPSLALAQAANETAWGTSRFAVEANNYFGVWCYREGCGLVPLERDAGLRHEVQSFNSVADSVQAYLHMLNSGKAYASLRSIRQRLQAEQRRLSGYELAAGLLQYSAHGMDYVDSIRGLMQSNNLYIYTDAFYASLEDWRGSELRAN